MRYHVSVIKSDAGQEIAGFTTEVPPSLPRIGELVTDSFGYERRVTDVRWRFDWNATSITITVDAG